MSTARKTNWASRTPETFLGRVPAVQYAHQHLVLHRDLKPGNILVTPQGEPKLLDFGIAKIAQSGESGGPGESPATALPMMTPEYASPEQVRNASITTASDIYSLGVILYKLLCGRVPFCSKDGSPHEIFRAVCETEPAKPSSVARHAEAPVLRQQNQGRAEFGKRGERSSALVKVLGGDLDNIVLKALRKEPQRRYARPRSSRKTSAATSKVCLSRPTRTRSATGPENSSGERRKLRQLPCFWC